MHDSAGLVTEVPAKLRIYILEYMAHLSLKDWKAVGDDFVKLQFVAEDSKNPNEVPGLMDSVGVILDLLMGGGGMQSLDKVKVCLVSIFPWTRLHLGLVFTEL